MSEAFKTYLGPFDCVRPDEVVKREHPFPGNMTYYLNTFTPDSADPELPPENRVEADIDKANLLSSEASGIFAGLHRPVLDIDFPAKLVPSSTPGRFHLYLDIDMPWADYEKLLKVMAEVGVLEPGYVAASIERKATFVRLPWVRKDAT